MHVAQWGTFVSSEVDVENRTAKVNIQVEVNNELDKSQSLQVRNTIVDRNGVAVRTDEKSMTVDAMSLGEIQMNMSLSDVSLWSLNDE